MTRSRSHSGAGSSGTAASSANGLTMIRLRSEHTSHESTCRATRLRISGEYRPSQPDSRASSSVQSLRPCRAISSAPSERSTWSRSRVSST